MNDVRAREVVVVGGGITGLAAAHRVLEIAAARGEGVRLTVLEAGARPGGTIASERTEGFLFETGADSIITEKPWGLDLCRRLGVMDRLIGTREGDRRTFVVLNGRLHPLPEGFLLLAPMRVWPVVTSSLFSLRGKLRMACDLVLPRGGNPGGDESLASFVTRRLGREVLERVAQPLVGGIYTADAERLSLAATMPRFLEMERRHRSLIRAVRCRPSGGTGGAGTGGTNSGDGSDGASDSGARWSLFVSFAEGMQTLVDALAKRLPEGSLHLGARVVAVAPDAAAGWHIMLDGGDRVAASSVVLATPAFVAADLLRPADAALASALDGIHYASSATVSLAYSRADIPHPLDGFGFVVPAVERRSLIACSFSSVKYEGRAPEGSVLLRVFCGGALSEFMVARSGEELIAEARRELRELLGVTAPPRMSRVHRHLRAMPQYHVGHLERVGEIEARVARRPGLALAGNAYRGVGVPDCIHSGERAAEGLLEGGAEASPGERCA